MSATIEQVIATERQQIDRARRAKELPLTDERPDTVGLALSCGGVRSASFGLGVIQGLARTGLLNHIDYVSSLGGGAYIAGSLVIQAQRGKLAEPGMLLRNRLPPPPATGMIWLRNITLHLVAVGMITAAAFAFEYQQPWMVHQTLLWVGIALLVLARTPMLSLNSFLRKHIVRAYLGSDCPLRALDDRLIYPLFEGKSGPAPFLLSPRFCGPNAEFEPTFRISLAEAIVASGPPPDRHGEPVMVPEAILVLVVLAGVKSVVKFLFNMDETSSRLIAVDEGKLFDPLGVYPLIQRRCRFIIACDGTHDPRLSMDGLANVIRRCRADLGVSIDISLGGFVIPRMGDGLARRHYELGVIHYPDDMIGMLLYLKPSLTGDESADVRQYARSHPEFPSADKSSGDFDDAEFLSYRQLGEHVIDTLAGEVGSAAAWGRMPIEEVIHDIRQLLRPDLAEADRRPQVAGADDPIPAELVEAVASGNCLLCAGAGLAAQAGLPTWPDLFTGLLRVAQERSLSSAAVGVELAAAIAAGDLEEAGDELAHKIPAELTLSYLASALPDKTAPSPAHRLLAGMPFLGALNTSLDAVLAAAFDQQPSLAQDVDKLVADLQSRSRFTVNVTGLASRASSVVLNSRQFRIELSKNLQFKQFLATLLLRYHTLFVGSSIDGIRGFLDALDLTKPPERRQFALVPRGAAIEPVHERYLDRTYNVRIIEYQPGFNYAGLVDYLTKLNEAVKVKLSQTAVPASASSASGESVTGRLDRVRRTQSNLTLRRIALENIGPFESLSLDLTAGWNLLLGDNGKGKTVILRAVAAALCGQHADAASVTRLLRTGSTHGRIQLSVADRDYIVELKRDTEGKVVVASASLSPIQADRWLVIGFPALRSVPWENPAGPEERSSKGPSAEDLLPLLRGLPDGRVANLKQWLVNLDYAGRQEVVADFFRVLQELTPGLRLEYQGVIKETMEVKVRANADVVPLSAVSQGTGSVMCWIGTLLQRLSECGLTRDDRALVLIDEIDAHMHPKWQQLFIDAFRAQFPSVQVIATSHSPLLVGSLRKEEIWLVREAPLESAIHGVAHVRPARDGSVEIRVTGPEPDEDEGPAAKRQIHVYSVRSGTELRIRDGEIVQAGEALTKHAVRMHAERLDLPPEGWRVDQILTLPYFGLETTRDAKTSALIDEFTRLAAAQGDSPQADPRLAEVAAKLEMRAPAPHERAEARQAFELINDFAQERLKNLTPEQREKVLTEAKAQLTESITGSRRPT
jgi:hypothetical protein